MGRTAKTQIELQIIPGITLFFVFRMFELFNLTNMLFVCYFVELYAALPTLQSHESWCKHHRAVCDGAVNCKFDFRCISNIDLVSIESIQIPSYRIHMVNLGLHNIYNNPISIVFYFAYFVQFRLYIIHPKSYSCLYWWLNFKPEWFSTRGLAAYLAFYSESNL